MKIKCQMARRERERERERAAAACTCTEEQAKPTYPSKSNTPKTQYALPTANDAVHPSPFRPTEGFNMVNASHPNLFSIMAIAQVSPCLKTYHPPHSVVVVRSAGSASSGGGTASVAYGVDPVPGNSEEFDARPGTGTYSPPGGEAHRIFPSVKVASWRLSHCESIQGLKRVISSIPERKEAEIQSSEGRSWYVLQGRGGHNEVISGRGGRAVS